LGKRIYTYRPEKLDDVLHTSRLRFAIMMVLVTVEQADFTFLRDQTVSTDGNVGAQLKKLEEAGYISATKRLVRRWRMKDYALTPKGRKTLMEYLKQMEGCAKTIRAREDQ
jgi:DNA-binding MarR family transcriptional regulator